MSKQNYRNGEPTVTTEEEVLQEAPKKKVYASGVVSGCRKLNIRKRANRTADVLCEISEKSTLSIDMDKSTSDWYSVRTETGIRGYCMKQYVTVNG